jgi:hypothetical protein
MKLKRWMQNLFKLRFYLGRQTVFLSGSYGQTISVRLRLLESFMPLPLARCAVALCFCWGLFLAIPATVFGQTNYYAAYGTEYPVIGSLPGDQVFPDVALNTNGGYVVWQDNITDPVGEGISAMQLNSTLSGSGSTFQVNVVSTNNQGNAHVALLQKGGAVFVWQGGPDIAQHIYARFLSSSNLWLNSTNILVSTSATSFQETPAVATLANGNIIVVWASFNQVSSSSLFDIYGQLLSTNGTAIGTNFLINQYTTYNQRNPAVAALNNGGFVVAWVSETNSVSGTNSLNYGSYPEPLPSVELIHRLYTISGSSAVPTTGEIQVNQDLNPCSSPSIAVAADGSYMITWCANNLVNSDNGWDVYERSFTNGVGGSVNLVNSYTYGDQYNPHISVIGGNYLIVWTSLGEDGSREGVFGQFVSEGNTLVGGQFLVNTTTAGQQMQPVVASDGYDQFLAVWTSFTFSPGGFDLYAQRYINSEAVLEPMAAPYVWVPFVVSNGVYQPELVVSWPPVQGLAVSNYEVYVDGAVTSTAMVATNGWTMTKAYGLSTNSTHSFAVTYVTSLGFQSPISPSTSGTTWSGLNYYGIPYEWMALYFGGYFGGTYHTNGWPPVNLAPPGSPAGSPTVLQLFLTGGIPYEPNTWLATALTKTSQGIFLSWNTQPGMTYQVQQLAPNMMYYFDVGAPRFESGTSDSVYVGNSKAGFYRVLLLRQ